MLPLSLVAAFVVAQPAAGLNLTNPRNTYGELGGTRPAAAFLPGDVVFVAYDIEGVTVDDAGRAAYTMAMEVKDKAGKSIFKQDPSDRVDYVPLGGNRLPGKAFVTLGVDMPAGQYTMAVTVTDKTSKAAKTLERPFEVAAKQFGIVQAVTSWTERGDIPAPTTGIVGQSMFVQFATVGFARDPQRKQPKLLIEMTILDEAGKPTVVKPASLLVEGGVDEKEEMFSVRFVLPLTRAGKYTIKLKAADQVANKTATFDLPLAVLGSAN